MLEFNLGDMEMALPAALVREVAPMPLLARVPHGPDPLLGMANIRGQVVPVVSVSRLLDMEEAAVNRVVVTECGGRVALAVTAVLHVGKPRNASRVLDLAALLARVVPGSQRPRQGANTFDEAPSASKSVRESSTALLTFGVGGQEFGLPAVDVAEVLRVPRRIATVPRSDDVVLGTTATRGAVLPLLSLARLLALPETDTTARSRIVVARIGVHRVGLLVSEARGIEHVPLGDIDILPQALRRTGGEACIQSICRLDGGRRLLSVLSPAHLLRDELTGRLLQDDTAPGAHVRARHATLPGDDGRERFLAVRIADESFALPIAHVHEIAVCPAPIAPLPNAPAFLRGIMNLRGQAVPVIDLTWRFAGVAASGRRQRVIVSGAGDAPSGFVVDEVLGVMTAGPQAVADAPMLSGEARVVFERVALFAGHDKPVPIVSPHALLGRAQAELSAPLGRGSGRHRP